MALDFNSDPLNSYTIGSKMESTYYQLTRVNDDLYTHYKTHIATRFGLNRSTTSTSAFTFCRFKMYRNLDNQPVKVRVHVKAETQNATVLVLIGSVTTSQSVTAGSEGFFDITVTPSGTDSTRDCYIKGVVTSGGTLHLNSFSAWIEPSAVPTGVSSSGYIHTAANSGHLVADERAISTERLSRLRANPVKLAKDRPQCLLSYVNSAYRRTAEWLTTKTTLTTVAKAWLPVVDEGLRAYRYYAYVESSAGTTATSRLLVGGLPVSDANFSGDGWHTVTFEEKGKPIIGLPSVQPGGDFRYVPVDFQMASDGGGVGDVQLTTLQIFREPTL